MKKETVIHIERSGPEPRYSNMPQFVMGPKQELRVIIIEETPELKSTESEAAPIGYEVGAFLGEKPLFKDPKVPMINAAGSFILVKESDVDSYMSEGCKRYSDVYNQYLDTEEEHEKRMESLAKSCRDTQNNVYQNIANKSFAGGEPELNEEAISKLCDDLIEAKKEPLSAAQIIDKYARRD